MSTQTFRAPDVMTALMDVQKNLGKDAIIVSVRQVPGGPVWQVWRTPQVEVVAFPMGSNKVKTSLTSLKTGSFQRPSLDQGSTIQNSTKNGLANRSSLEGVDFPRTLPSGPMKVRSKTGLQENSTNEQTVQIPEALAKVCQKLASQGIDNNLVEKIVKTCFDTLSSRGLEDPVRLHDFIEHQLVAHLRTSRNSVLSNERIICLVGFSGSGKTSVCAKLAAYHSCGLKRKVVWICADTFGAGAISQARLYTDTFGIPLHTAYTPDELMAAIESEQKTDLIIVDMPGCNPYQETSVLELGDLLTVIPGRSTYLVAPATSKDNDLNKALSAFSPFNLKGLVITRLDVTGTYGNVFNLAWRSQLPLTYFSTGQQIPDDFQIAQPAQLVASILGDEWVK